MPLETLILYASAPSVYDEHDINVLLFWAMFKTHKMKAVSTSCIQSTSIELTEIWETEFSLLWFNFFQMSKK